jgi:Domain of unknown function (DUF4294)
MRRSIALFFMCLTCSVFGQVDSANVKVEKEINVIVDGKSYKAIVTPEGDTMILADIDDVSITSPASFANDDEYKKYLKFRRYASIVFPYAKEVIRIWRESEYASQHMTAKQRKKKLKELDERLTKEFETPLKNLTKLQGKILVKMIEKEIGQNMYTLIKDVKGGFNAFYWNQFSKLYSYDLKEGYVPGAYPILDVVLKDFDVSYRIENESSMKYFDINEFKKKKN